MPRMAHVGNDIWEKRCTKCSTIFNIKAVTWDDARKAFWKYFSQASAASRTYDDLTSWCVSCKNDGKYGRLDGVHRDEVLADQDNKCGICCIEISFEKRTANLDHDHATGQSRKVLCRLCNVWMAAVDNDEWLAKAITYRDKYRG